MATTQLLIIGNGFDLHCGLKSSYKDFFCGAIFDTIGGQFGLSQMKNDVSGFWEGLLLEYYKAYGNQDYSWCDIETIIKEVLRNVLSLSTGFNLGHKILSFVKNRLDLYEQKLYGDETPIERYIFIYCVKALYQVETNIRSDTDRLKYLGEKLLLELHGFERRFCKYVKDNIVNPVNEKELNNKYIINAVNLLARLTGFSTPDFEDIDDIIDVEEKQTWEQSSPNERHSVTKQIKVLSEEFNNLSKTNILSFNYTALFDILGVDSPCAYSNVHGKLCNERCNEDCKASSVIFGIDDTLIQAQEVNSELRIFSKTYRKMLNTSAPISILPPNNDHPLEIKFYGHSLSEADYSYFQSIFDFYDIYANSKVSLIFYYSKGYEQNDAVYRLINSYGKTIANKDQGKNLVHKLLLENRLKVVEIPEIRG